ncbi:MAG: DUF3303 family protein [Nitrososphaeria archaeon]
MPKFYVKWWLEPTKVPTNAEERLNGWMLMLEAIKADLNVGAMKDWGIAAGGDFGYAISEAKDEAALFARLLKYIPFAHFEVVPILTADQAIEVIKKIVAKK